MAFTIGRISVLVATFALAGCTPVDPTTKIAAASPADVTPVRIVTPQDVEATRRGGAAFALIDVNPREIYDDGHVPGALWMAFDDVEPRNLPVDKSTPVILYCYNEVCGASHQAAELVSAAGWRDVRRMSAGISGWRAAGFAIEVTP